MKPNGDSALTSSFPGYIGYDQSLEEYVINKVNESEIAKAQKKDKNVNVLTGKKFGVDEKFTAENLTPEQQAYLATLDAAALAEVVTSYQENANANYESNLQKLGIANLDDPDTISLFPINFDAKTEIEQIIQQYNEGKDEEDQITYTDMMGTMIASVSLIVDVISTVLIAFVAVSLVVSCIMIGIITHISVMERTKEIGILRALGASKHNVSQVFNAETFIVGICAGLLGVGVSALLTIPINAVLESLLGIEALTVALPAVYAVVLVALSVVITMIGGLLPAKRAAKQDAVIALRTE